VQRQASEVVYALEAGMVAPRRVAFVRRLEKRPQLELYSVALACLFQTPCPAHRALVRLYLQEMCLVCPEVSPLEGPWRVALLRVK
jgi:predicted Abi (CAAX) family protease